MNDWYQEIYQHGDSESPFFREDFAERRSCLRPGESPLAHYRANRPDEKAAQAELIGMLDRVLSQSGALK